NPVICPQGWPKASRSTPFLIWWATRLSWTRCGYFVAEVGCAWRAGLGGLIQSTISIPCCKCRAGYTSRFSVASSLVPRNFLFLTFPCSKSLIRQRREFSKPSLPKCSNSTTSGRPMRQWNRIRPTGKWLSPFSPDATSVGSEARGIDRTKRQTNTKHMKRIITTVASLALATTLTLAKDLINADAASRTGLQGYDPVAFFTDAKPAKGNPAITAEFDGVTYFFASEKHKAAFMKSPQDSPPYRQRLLNRNGELG